MTNFAPNQEYMVTVVLAGPNGATSSYPVTTDANGAATFQGYDAPNSPEHSASATVDGVTSGLVPGGC